MKFLAILKDSVREALDSKVLYALLILAVLVIVGVASISFQPRPAEQGVSDIVARFPGAQPNFRNPDPPLRYEVENLKVSDQKKPWEGEYHFDLVVREVILKDAEGKEVPTEGVFRLIVFASSLQKEEGKLTPEEKESRTRLAAAMQQEGQELPRARMLKLFDEKMRTEAAQVGAAQMEGFIAEQLTSRGTLQAEEVRLESDQPREIRFAVRTAPRAETFRTWPHEITYGFGAYTSHGDTQIGPLLFSVESTMIGSVGAGIAMLLATVVTAFFIPNMLRKGTVDLLLAKPIHRATLLVYKYIGGLTFMFLTTLVTVVGVWLALGLRSGLWAPNFLLTIFILTFQFAIFYAISTVIAVLTRSPIVCILVACFSWVILWAVGAGHMVLDATRDFKDVSRIPGWLYVTGDTAHFVLPRYKDLDVLNSELIGRDLLGPDSPERKIPERIYAGISWGKSLGFTVGFIALMLALAAWAFAWKDY